MSAFPKISLAVFAFIASTSLVNAIELDTPDAHIVVVRPIDSYGIGEQKLSNRQLEKHEDKVYAFAYLYGNAKDKQYVKATDDENPIPLGVKEVALTLGFTPNSGTFGNTGISNEILRPWTLTPQQAQDFTSRQNASWPKTVISMGDPNQMEDRTSGAQTANNWKGVGNMVLGGVIGAFAGNAIGNPINATGGAVIGSQFANTRFSVYTDLADFNPLPSVDYSKYKTVDVRKVTLGQRFGNIIIAYKGERTDAAEKTALIAAIPALLGFDETVDQIKEARALDLANRQRVWDQCVTAGLEQCTKKDKE